eukprot:110801-Pyramimonas_sp.AAC.1
MWAIFPPCRQHTRQEREAQQLLPRAPRHAFPPKAMFYLRVRGLPVEYRSVSSLCRAAMLRTTLG